MAGASSSLSLRGGGDVGVFVFVSVSQRGKPLRGVTSSCSFSSSRPRCRVVGGSLRGLPATPSPTTAAAGACASQHQQQQHQHLRQGRRGQLGQLGQGCLRHSSAHRQSAVLSTRHGSDLAWSRFHSRSLLVRRVRFNDTGSRGVAGGVLDVQASDDPDADAAAAAEAEAVSSSSSRDDGENGAEEDASEPEMSSRDIFAQLVRFTLPTMAIWMCGPVLSMVDTSVVGIASTLELAAMSPGGVFVDYPSYLVSSSLAVATTTLVAQDRLRDRRESKEEEKEKRRKKKQGIDVDGDGVSAASAASASAAASTISDGLTIAALSGLVIGAVLLLVARPAISAFAGKGREGERFP